MLLTLLVVQLLNGAILWFLPPPAPHLTPLTTVAAALAGNAPASLRVVTGSAIDDRRGDPHDERVRAALARLLSVPEAAVRLRKSSPSLFGPAEGGGGPGGASMFHRGPPPDFNDDAFLTGDFAVSARIGGVWRTVTPAVSSAAPWRSRTLIWLLVALLVVAPVAWLLARLVTRPIGAFAAAAERLGRDPRAPPLTLTGPSEIGDAAAAFNEMQARLNRYVEDRTMLMAAIAHDLRTPLMRLGLRLEQAPDDLRDACEGDVRDMEAMIAAVMSFVRDMTRSSRHQRLDLRALAESVVDSFADMGDSVALAPGDAVVLDGDPPALKAMLANLIGNAVKYAGSAEVTLGRKDGMALIDVADRGPGIAPPDLDRAFEPFFRAERSRNRDTGGIGLGLASVRAVARAHGGEATLVNRAGGGLLATVTLPLGATEISGQ
ncbi:HAMP domain-containing protein [Hephaestia sp. CMS5P-6]|nr:ATP-binding protein [Hephaestia mangrovi]MBY8829404.1 HAMP domain-containing protein [Hephaestia mangrovi]